jgi:hypothetical protein
MERSEAMTATTTAAGEPTIVLAHEAFAESASWNGVTASLLYDGYRPRGRESAARRVRADRGTAGARTPSASRRPPPSLT